MDVQAAHRRQVQQPAWQELAKRCHYQHLRLCEPQRLACSRGVAWVLAVETEASRLRNRNAVLQGIRLDGRRLQAKTPTRRPIRLSQDERNLETGGDDLLQCRTRELRRAGKGDLHGR